MFDLPTTLIVNEKEYRVETDFRKILNIMLMFEDEELTIYEKQSIMLKMLYIDPPPVGSESEATHQAAYFIDGGIEESRGGKSKDLGRLYSWNQDKVYILSGIDKTLGYSSRSCDYLHWWLFLGALLDMGECTFSHIIHMRRAKKENKLSKEEKKQWSENPDLYELRIEQRTAEDLLDLING